MKIYNKINYFILEKYLSLDNILERTISRWDNFVCNFFGWNSYYVKPQRERYLESYLENVKPLEKILDNIAEWFDVKFTKKGIRIVNKNLRTSFA